MPQLNKYIPSITSVLLMWLVVFLLYPHFQYYVDPDGTAYLTIAKKYADGDFMRAINGYWSPWSCWLTATVIKFGLQPIPASVVANVLGAAGFLVITQSFLLKFNIDKKLQWFTNISLIVFLCYAVFWQSFDDLWECFFLLAALRLMLATGFKTQPFLWVACGAIGALGYFAKAYALPFFVLNIICCTYLLTKRDIRLTLRIVVVSVATMVILSLPWIYALHLKYGIWTTSTAGSLNMSWYLVGHPYYKEGIGMLIPPVYKDSPYFWEDPYLVNGPTPHFWSSWHLFGLQFLRIGMNLWKLLKSMLELSLFFPFIGVVAALSLFRQRVQNMFTEEARIVILSFLLFPLGYVLINFEARYLWYMLPISIVIGCVLLQTLYFPLKKVVYLLFPVSIAIYPAYALFTLLPLNGKTEFNIAQWLKAHNVHGSFTANLYPGQMGRLAYFWGQQYYYNPSLIRTDSVIIRAAEKEKVDYYFRLYYNRGDYSPDDEYPKNLTNSRGEPLQEITAGDTVTGVRIYRLK